MQANRTLDCTDSGIIFETCKIHSLTFPSNYLILGLDFSMPLAPSFHIVLVNKLLPFAMWTSLTSRTTMGAVWPCLLPGLGHPQLVSTGWAFCVFGTDSCHFSAVLRLHFHEYRFHCITAKCKKHGTIRFNPFRMWGTDSPALAVVQALPLCTSYTDFYSCAFNRFGLATSYAGRCTLYRRRHAALPFRFPFSDKSQNNRLLSAEWWASFSRFFWQRAWYLYLPLAKGGIP